MIFDRRLVPPGDKENLVDLVSNQLFRYVLNNRFPRHRQHFFGLRFGGREQSGADAGYGDNCASNHLLNITGCVLMIHLEASRSDSGKRLDLYLHERLPEYSRARIQEWIKAGRVRVDDTPQKRSYLLHGSEAIDVEPAELPPLH